MCKNIKWVPVSIQITITNDHVLIKFDQDNQIYTFSKEDVYTKNTLSEMSLAKAISTKMIKKGKKSIRLNFFPASLPQQAVKQWIELGCPQPR